VHFTDLVVHTGVVEDALGRRGLAGVDVRRDTDVAVALDGGLAGHDVTPNSRGRRGFVKPEERPRNGRFGLEAEVRERLVGFGHAVHFVALLHRAAAAFDGLEQFVGQRCAIDFSPRLRADSFSQRIASATRRTGRTSTGTW
jgi:hypothetical protein